VAKLDANVERFGYENMQQEIQELKYNEDQFSKDCDSVSSHLSIKKDNISAMNKQEMICWIASDKPEHYLTDWLRKRQTSCYSFIECF
jgi:hypothetical protein